MAPLLELSPDGLYYVEDEEGGKYEIVAFLGDDYSANCQVFRAKYSTDKKNISGEISDEIPQFVALKLARNNFLIETLKEEAEKSFKIGPNDDQENNVITDNNIVVGIYKTFDCRAFFCVSMPYFEAGSLRYILNKRNCKLPEKFVAVILKEVLNGLRFLHGRGKVHKRLNAASVFVCYFQNSSGRRQVAFKLGYQGSTYFHSPEADVGSRIWDQSTSIWDPEQGDSSSWNASWLEENCFWSSRLMYEPSDWIGQRNYTPASDIWNLGVLAIELASGTPFRIPEGRVLLRSELRTPEEFLSFLEMLHRDRESRLPTLPQLFLPKSREGSQKAASNQKSQILVNAAQMAKNFAKKLEVVNIICGKLPKPEWLDSDTDNQDQPVLTSSSLTAMVKRCLVLDPNQRPTAEMLLNDPFFEEHQDADFPSLLDFFLKDIST